MNEWLLIIASLVALPYLLVPFFIKRNHVFSLKPQIRPMTQGFLPQAVLDCFAINEQNLLDLDFTYCIDAISRDFGPDMKVYLRLYVAKKKSVVAIATALTPEGFHEPIMNFIEFTSRFSDGREVSTHNSSLLGAPIEHKSKVAAYFPHIVDLKILFDCHQAMLKKLNLLNEDTYIPEEGHEISYLIKNFEDDLLAQTSLGCLAFDADHNCYRPTWAGAFLMGWYSMWPLSFLRPIIRRLRARLLMKSLLSS